MILNISTRDVYSVLSWISNITDLCTVFNQPPSVEPTTPYITISKVTDNTRAGSNIWFLEKTARISITIVWNAGWDDQWVVEWLQDVITNEIVVEDCMKITVPNVTVTNITEDTSSPLLYTDKRRQYIVKDYLFTYNAING